MTKYTGRKILNDPIYGFITISDTLILEIIEHPYFQRLRRIKQLGLTHYVYPGAMHTRFQHAIGAMHLMEQAVAVLKMKGVTITPEEHQAVLMAILLHDIGHGPFSHALENSIITGTHHEEISALIFDQLNEQFYHHLDLAISIFKNQYPKKFLHQLVASQLDMDRLDYLRRDSFFSGVTEGTVGSERIIKMLNVAENELVAEDKGIYSIEKFVMARRLMYWQVYMHKTVLSAEYLLVKILQRAKELVAEGKYLPASSYLELFLKNPFQRKDLLENPSLVQAFAKLDDFDVVAAVKSWCDVNDYILKTLSNSLINRRLYKVRFMEKPLDAHAMQELKLALRKMFSVTESEWNYFVFQEQVYNHAYNPNIEEIKILYKNSQVKI